MQDFCDNLYNMTSTTLADYRVKIDSNGNPEIACFTRDLESYLTVILAIIIVMNKSHRKSKHVMFNIILWTYVLAF